MVRWITETGIDVLKGVGWIGLKPNGSDVNGSMTGTIILLLPMRIADGLRSEELWYHNIGRVGTGTTGHDQSLLSGVITGLMGLVGLGGRKAEGTGDGTVTVWGDGAWCCSSVLLLFIFFNWCWDLVTPGSYRYGSLLNLYTSLWPRTWES